MVEVLCSLVNLVMESKYWSDDWRLSYIVPLFKAGYEKVAGNYTGIALGCCVAKVMTRVLAGRLSKFSDNRILTEGQGGFRPGRGFADQVLVLRSVYDIMRSQVIQTFLAFLDLCKAYDTEWRERLWMKMRGYGVQEEIVNVCKSSYEGIEASVLLGGEYSRWFEVEAGLRQGCPLSPVLYSVYVMEC